MLSAWRRRQWWSAGGDNNAACWISSVSNAANSAGNSTWVIICALVSLSVCSPPMGGMRMHARRLQVQVRKGGQVAQEVEHRHATRRERELLQMGEGKQALVVVEDAFAHMQRRYARRQAIEGLEEAIAIEHQGFEGGQFAERAQVSKEIEADLQLGELRERLDAF
jgi:hypothetical protein